jgi:hypothetical protein
MKRKTFDRLLKNALKIASSEEKEEEKGNLCKKPSQIDRQLQSVG